MIPLSLTLRGFIGIRSGLGRDELTLDLEHLVGDAQLVALIGPNGTGKSTVLDNLHPYRLMPSRATSYTPGGFSFFDETFGQLASKELTWQHETERYRSSILLRRSGKTQKQEAFLHRENQSGTWVPVAPSDGKTSTYDEALESLLGSPELFFTAAFSAQGRRSLSAYTNGEIKALMTELLGLDRIAELGGRARDRTKDLSGNLSVVRGRLGVEEDLLQHRSAQADMLRESHAALDICRASQDRARSELSAARAKLAEIETAQAAVAATESRRAAILDRGKGVKDRALSALAQAGADIRAAQEKWLAEQNRGEVEQRELTGMIAALESRIAMRSKILDRRATIEEAEARAEQITAMAADTKTAVDSLRAGMETARARTGKRAALSEHLRSLLTEGRSAKQRCDDLETRARLTEEVPVPGHRLAAALQTAGRGGIRALRDPAGACPDGRAARFVYHHKGEPRCRLGRIGRGSGYEPRCQARRRAGP